MTSAEFQVRVTAQDALDFAKLSGDWNPLHTDAAYAAQTAYMRPVLHGAFSAGLFSRMAGMHLPGVECLLHNLRLRFAAPIIPPATLTVGGRITTESGGLGRVEVSIADAETGSRYVDGSYEYSRHERTESAHEVAGSALNSDGAAEAPILVTGANGGLGRAVLERLGSRAVGLSRSGDAGTLRIPDLAEVAGHLPFDRISGIVHCAWPAPGNERLTSLRSIDQAIDFNLSTPLMQSIALAQLLAERGTPGAMLVLVGSTAASAGRHNYRMPLYTLSKALIPELTRILATELAASNRRCVALTFDVLEGGMNKRLSASARIAHTDRIPSGRLPGLSDAAAQVSWLLDNSDSLISGANISVTGSAIP